MQQMDIPKAVKEAVHRVDPTATVILYGSRGRGDARADSDWDFMILTQNSVEPSLKRDINHELFLVELESGELISGIMRQRDTWNSKTYDHSDLRSNVVREGITV